MSRRTERISELLRDEIARALREDAGDPRLTLVTLTRVDVAPDLSNAVVFWSTLDAPGVPDRDAAEDALDAAAPFLRGRVAKRVQLKRTPELRFRFDPGLSAGDETLALLREIADDTKE